jgi:hypothetical protein
MTTAVADLQVLLRNMEPALNPGVYVFATLPEDLFVPSQEIVACIREPEGMSVVLTEADALKRNLPILFRAAWITLTVHSDLEAVGLTAAFASALGEAGISCNVVAGARHDHIFVPYAEAFAAVAALLQLQQHHAHGA